MTSYPVAHILLYKIILNTTFHVTDTLGYVLNGKQAYCSALFNNKVTQSQHIACVFPVLK